MAHNEACLCEYCTEERAIRDLKREDKSYIRSRIGALMNERDNARERIAELEAQLAAAQSIIADLRDYNERAPKLAAEEADKQAAELKAELAALRDVNEAYHLELQDAAARTARIAELEARPCPHVVVSGESRYCALAEEGVKALEAQLREAEAELATAKETFLNIAGAAQRGREAAETRAEALLQQRDAIGKIASALRDDLTAAERMEAFERKQHEDWYARTVAAEERAAKMRAILEGAGYDDLDDLDDTLKRDIEDCRRVGETVGSIVEGHIAYSGKVEAKLHEAEAQLAKEKERADTAERWWDSAIQAGDGLARSLEAQLREAEARAEAMKEENTCLQSRVAIAESNAAEIYLQGALSDTHLGDCQTFYDWCRCTVGTLEHNIKRAVEAEARAEAAERELANFKRWLNKESAFLSKDDVAATLLARAEAAETENVKLRAALEIYARPKNWYRMTPANPCRQYLDIYEEDGRTLDGWIIAEDALRQATLQPQSEGETNEPVS